MVRLDEAIDAKVDEAIKELFNSEKPWITIVWDDPVNLMSYVTYVLMELFSFPREKKKLMTNTTKTRIYFVADI